MASFTRPANKEPGRRYGDLPVAGVSTIRHLGNDYGWGSGWQVYAAASGRVSVVRWSKNRATNNRSGGYGNYIIIDHGNGYQTLYAHLPNTAPFVAVGDQVTARQQIGLMGNTGNASGSHLHFEVRLNGRIIDPNPLIGNSVASAESSILIDLAETRRPMSALIRNYDGSVGLVTEDGELIPLASMTEVDSLRATGLVGDFVQMPDGLIWNTLAAITARKLAQRTGSPAAVASALAPLLIPAVLVGLKSTGATLTEQQVTEAAEAAIRKVFADAAS